MKYDDDKTTTTTTTTTIPEPHDEIKKQFVKDTNRLARALLT